jgi:hypothetical protein
MVYYNYVVDGVVVEGPIAYPDVLSRTGLRDQVGLTELGWIEDMPVPETPQLTKEQIETGIRNMRNYLLQQSDWTQLPDSPLTQTQKSQWATYRQQLRDMPETFKDVTNFLDVVPPTAPTNASE